MGCVSRHPRWSIIQPSIEATGVSKAQAVDESTWTRAWSDELHVQKRLKTQDGQSCSQATLRRHLHGLRRRWKLEAQPMSRSFRRLAGLGPAMHRPHLRVSSMISNIDLRLRRSTYEQQSWEQQRDCSIQEQQEIASGVTCSKAQPKRHTQLLERPPISIQQPSAISDNHDSPKRQSQATVTSHSDSDLEQLGCR